MNEQIQLDNLDAIIFDFDGVLTDNRVYLNENGEESVACNRSDGIGFNVLNKIKKPTYIVSSETNRVVTQRAKKVNIPVIHGVNNKLSAIEDLSASENISLERTLYVGNDLNDFHAMKRCGFSVCPADSHPKIKEISNWILQSNGGDGVVREIVELLLKIDIVDTIYNFKKEEKL